MGRAGADPTQLAHRPPLQPRALTAANLVTVIASSYGRTCTSVCSWSQRNQNRVCLQPRGWGGGGTVCSVTWGNYTQAPCHLSPEPQSGAALKARRPTVSSRVKGSQGRGFGPSASEAMNSPTPAWKGRKGGWERKGPKQRGRFSTPGSPPHPVPARIPICVSASSPDGKPAAKLSKGHRLSTRSLPSPSALSAPPSFLAEDWGRESRREARFGGGRACSQSL